MGIGKFPGVFNSLFFRCIEILIWKFVSLNKERETVRILSIVNRSGTGYALKKYMQMQGLE